MSPVLLFRASYTLPTILDLSTAFKRGETFFLQMMCAKSKAAELLDSFRSCIPRIKDVLKVFNSLSRVKMEMRTISIIKMAAQTVIRVALNSSPLDLRVIFELSEQ